MPHYFRLERAQLPFSGCASPRMALRTPLMVINLKTYLQGHGEAGFALCREMAAVAEASGACLAAATSALDLRRFAYRGGVPVLAQHIDAATAGAHTGAILPEAAVAAGAVGTLVNHAERQLNWPTIEATLVRAREAGLATVLCTADVEATARGAALRPDYLAVEPPELIGGDISVST
ncbi:MAG TPA: triose-phosphate isomerase, partial [Candidatus Poseidoniales archaeon]|nr:triose-phosphate isomerase [Candidatus Poseidoniales archaeon]